MCDPKAGSGGAVPSPKKRDGTNTATKAASQTTTPHQSQDDESKVNSTENHKGWIQWTNSGKMSMSKKEKNVFVFEGGAKRSFNAVEFRGSESEKKILQSDNWALGIEAKVVPDDKCPDQDMCIILDCVEANMLSANCDFLVIRINTHTRDLRVENYGPKSSGMTLFSKPDIPSLRPNNYINMRICGDSKNIRSISINGINLIQNLPFYRKNKPTNAIGLAVYGKSRILVRRLKIEESYSPRANIPNESDTYKAHQARSSSSTAPPSSIVTYSPHTVPVAGFCRSSCSSSTFDRSENDDLELMAIIERDIVVKDLRVSIDEIGGLETAKRALQEAVVLPILMPDFFTGIRQPWRGVLLFGPPGTGKTMLAKAIASIALDNSITFFNCSIATLTSKWRGESEKLLRALFSCAKQRDSILFFDEVDSLLSSRGSNAEHEASRRFKSEFLIHMDGLLSNTPSDNGSHQGCPFVLCTSNSPWDIDDALRRRLEKRVYIPLPDHSSRTQMIGLLLKELDIADEIDASEIANMTKGYSGSDLRLLMREAAMFGLRKLIAGLSSQEVKELRQNNTLTPSKVSHADILEALQSIQPSVSQMDIKRFEQWAAEFGST